MSTDAKAIQKLIDAYLDYEREMKKALSMEEIQKLVEAERVKTEKEQARAGGSPGTTRR